MKGGSVTPLLILQFNQCPYVIVNWVEIQAVQRPKVQSVVDISLHSSSAVSRVQCAGALCVAV